MMKFLVLCFSFSLNASLYAQDHWELRNDLEKRALAYFLEHSHPVTGQTRDKARNFNSMVPRESAMSSIAATGFSMAVISHSSLRGWATPELARNYVKKTLRFVQEKVPHHQGWFVHFLHWETGKRWDKTEYSTIDTALFLAGALYAAQVLKDPEIVKIANTLYERVDFSAFLTNGGQKPEKRTISLSWSPEEGYSRYQWSIYAEQMLLYILGLGHPKKPIPQDSWHAWSRALYGLHMPLFIHQYSHVFFDFRNLQDGYQNYFESGLKATFLHRSLGQEGFWGLSAGESPNGYAVFSPLERGSIFCIGCAVASAMYAPEIVQKDLANWKNGPYGKQLWGKYGPTDSIDLKRKWFSPHVLGITVGPAYMSLNNMEGKTSFWKDFMKIPAIQRAKRLMEYR